MIPLEIGEPFPVSIEKNSVKLTILNDWNTPFTLGTKLRKAEGFHFQLLKTNKKAIQIAGDPNSNFMAAFTLYFYSKGIPVLSIHSSRSGYKSGNRILSERFAVKKINGAIFIPKMKISALAILAMMDLKPFLSTS